MSRTARNTKPEQDTFQSVSECLKKMAEHCRAAADSLQAHLEEVKSPYQEALSEIVGTENELTRLLTDYANQGPDAVLETRVQFFPQFPDVSESDSPGEAITDLQQANEAGLQYLQEQMSNIDAPDVTEELDTLWRDVDKLCRRVSVIHTTMQDM